MLGDDDGGDGDDEFEIVAFLGQDRAISLLVATAAAAVRSLSCIYLLERHVYYFF